MARIKNPTAAWPRCLPVRDTTSPDAPPAGKPAFAFWEVRFVAVARLARAGDLTGAARFAGAARRFGLGTATANAPW
jgi:hypothetical protein